MLLRWPCLTFLNYQVRTTMPRLRSPSTAACAGCKHLRRKCGKECRFAPYFPASDPMKFVCIHSVYGTCNVSKILDDVEPEQRAFTVESLAFEANARLSSPVHGCVGIIYDLKGRIEELQSEIANARNELSAFTGPAAFGPLVPPFAFDPKHSEMGEFEAALKMHAEPIREQPLEHVITSLVQQQQNEGHESMNNNLQDQLQLQLLLLYQCQLPEDKHLQLHSGQHQLLDQQQHIVQQTSAMVT